MTSLEPLLITLWKDLHDLRVLWQVAAVALSIMVAAGVSYLLRPRMHTAAESKWEIGLGGLRRLLFPLSALLLVLIARWILRHYQSVSLLNIAVPLLAAMAIIRIIAYMLRLVFTPGGVLHVFERALAWLVWIGFALYVLGLAADIIEFFDDVSFHIGKQRISLLLIGQAVTWVIATLLLALWIGRLFEERLMAANNLDMTLRMTLTKLLRALLLLVAVLIALPAVGIDLTALSVFGGALGVGVGLGLQKIASNYISGFIILIDRSVKIGDLVTVENRTGEVTKMTARYIVVRSLDGTEAIIPNETMITSTVVNHSYSERRVRVAVQVQVGYASDVELALRLMVEIGKRHPRVLPTPEPFACIKSFADSGINLELGVWIEDPEKGRGNLCSDLYLGIWREFKANGIEIPFPQREVRILGAGESRPA